MESGKKVRTFEDLVAWQEAHRLVLLVYKLTKVFPDDERFGLTNQSRRAVISITSNIAEGFGRGSLKDKVHFYTMAKTSLAELHNQFIAARDLGYIDVKIYEQFLGQSITVAKLISGLINSAVNK